MIKEFIIYIILINIFSLLIYWWDKRRAIKGAFRISESSLLTLALFGGSLGSWSAMYLFRHKTRKPTFYLGIPLILLLQVAALIWYFFA